MVFIFLVLSSRLTQRASVEQQRSCSVLPNAMVSIGSSSDSGYGNECALVANNIRLIFQQHMSFLGFRTLRACAKSFDACV